MMRTYIPYFPVLLMIVLLFGAGCSPPDWEEHFDNQPETVNMQLWEAVKSVPEYSEFVNLVNSRGLDTLFSRN